MFNLYKRKGVAFAELNSSATVPTVKIHSVLNLLLNKNLFSECTAKVTVEPAARSLQNDINRYVMQIESLP